MKKVQASLRQKPLAITQNDETIDKPDLWLDVKIDWVFQVNNVQKITMQEHL